MNDIRVLRSIPISTSNTDSNVSLAQKASLNHNQKQASSSFDVVEADGEQLYGQGELQIQQNEHSSVGAEKRQLRKLSSSLHGQATIRPPTIVSRTEMRLSQKDTANSKRSSKSRKSSHRRQ